MCARHHFDGCSTSKQSDIRPRKRPEGQTPPRSHILRLRYPVLLLHRLHNHPSMADSPNLEIKLFTGQPNPGFFFLICFFVFFYHSRNPPALSLCLRVCACVCVIGSKRLGRSSSPTKTALGLKDGKASLSDVGKILQIQPQNRCPSPANPSEQLRPPRSSITRHIRSRKCAINRISHHSNTLNVSVCV